MLLLVCNPLGWHKALSRMKKIHYNSYQSLSIPRRAHSGKTGFSRQQSLSACSLRGVHAWATTTQCLFTKIIIIIYDI